MFPPKQNKFVFERTCGTWFDQIRLLLKNPYCLPKVCDQVHLILVVLSKLDTDIIYAFDCIISLILAHEHPKMACLHCRSIFIFKSRISIKKHDLVCVFSFKECMHQHKKQTYSRSLGLKVLDQITSKNKFCLNFKIKSVLFWVAHPKYRFVSCFEVVGQNDAYVIYCCIECGYHTLFTIWHVFDYLYTQFWNAKFKDANEKNMSHLLVWYQNLKNKLRY